MSSCLLVGVSAAAPHAGESDACITMSMRAAGEACVARPRGATPGGRCGVSLGTDVVDSHFIVSQAMPVGRNTNTLYVVSWAVCGFELLAYR